MNPTELRRAAERCKLDLTQQVSPDYNDTEDRLAIANYVLSTVREDDGEAITRGWLDSIGFYQDESDVIRHERWVYPENKYDDDQENIDNTVLCFICIQGNKWGFEIKHADQTGSDGHGCGTFETRGQLRRLLEGLGVS